MFTYKKHAAPTGLARVGATTWVDIKIKGKKCGTIYGGGWNSDGWKIQFCVEDESGSNPNCSWKNVTLKFKGDNLQECKDFLKENFVKLFNMQLHFHE